MSEPLKQAVKEIKKQSLNVRDAMKKIAYSFISSRQLSIQEADTMFCQSCALGYVLQQSLSLIQIFLTMELG